MPAELLLAVLDEPRLQALTIEGLEVDPPVDGVGLPAGDVRRFV